MSITQHILTKCPFSCIIVIGTWILCFMTIPETPLSSVRFIDKWTHSLIYLVLGICISLEYLHNTKQPSPKFIIVWVWFLPIIMGGLIEILQSYCTNGKRSGEWLDFFADAIGSTIAMLIGILLVRYRAKA
ncbi:VanZ family protein [Prevotella melaninogenica]|uniref:VanZ family protein n=1 Tax=Prevotella melaninogenica TaxID=28132 RepID=UPI001BA96411|nr:VanZ family protein [Prevotella melaninogenica]QUB68321.1 VanZ family protein [Prevotella melaninogenica]